MNDRSSQIVVRVRVAKNIWRELRIQALRQGKPVEVLVGEILEDWLRREVSEGSKQCGRVSQKA